MVTAKSVRQGLGITAAGAAAAYGAGIGADYIAHIGNNIPVLTSAVDAFAYAGRAVSDYLSSMGIPNNLNDPAGAVRFGGYLVAAAAGLLHATSSSSAISRKYRRGSGIHQDPCTLGSPEAEWLGIKRAA